MYRIKIFSPVGGQLIRSVFDNDNRYQAEERLSWVFDDAYNFEMLLTLDIAGRPLQFLLEMPTFEKDHPPTFLTFEILP